MESQRHMIQSVDDMQRENAALVAMLEATTRMLAYEAYSHEGSGDAKRRTYVGPIRSQVASARALLAQARGEPESR